MLLMILTTYQEDGAKSSACVPRLDHLLQELKWNRADEEEDGTQHSPDQISAGAVHQEV